MPVIESSLAAGSITALVLAGGRATRMGGVDKGLQNFNGKPLALHALHRLQRSNNPLIAAYAINANRHLNEYTHWGHPVWPDTLPEHPGPLAGMLTGLRHCTTSYLLTVPCDAPRFPLDLVERLAQAFSDFPATEIAMASAPDEDDVLRRQPVFALMRVSLAGPLERFMREGGRKVGHWMGGQRTQEVPFDRPTDDFDAFLNINTLDNLHAAEVRCASNTVMAQATNKTR